MLLCSQPESPKARLNEMTFSILVKAVPVLHSDEATQGDFKYTVLKKNKNKVKFKKSSHWEIELGKESRCFNFSKK